MYFAFEGVTSFAALVRLVMMIALLNMFPAFYII